MRILISIAFILCSCFTLRSQSKLTLTLEKDSIQIGEPVSVKFLISTSNPEKILGFNWKFNEFENLAYEKDTILFDKKGDVALLNDGNFGAVENDSIISITSDHINFVNGNWQGNLSITFYSPGIFVVNCPQLQMSNGEESLRSEPSLIKVLIPPGFAKDSTLEINDLKPIIQVPVKISDYLTQIFIALGVLLLALKTWLYFRKKKGKQIIESPEIMVDTRPAFEIALEALKSLDQKQLWQQGFIKEYQSELTYIMRSYIENRFDINALEMTTSDILIAISKQQISSELQDKLVNILTIADLVKFAKVRPGEDIHQSFLKDAIDFVNKTKNVVPK